MGKQRKDPEELLKKLEGKERSVRIRAIVFSTIPVVLGLIWLGYAGAQIFYAKTDLTAAEDTIGGLTADLAATEDTVGELTTDLAAAEDTVGELTTDLTAAEDTVGELTADLTAAREASQYFIQGFDSYRAGSNEAAISFFDRALELDPENPLNSVIFKLKEEATD